ncbi:MAG TPA: TPM domain-containing protein [Thermomicrobiales bacterium]|nr:TPM domain-containing protein [Thermomicrobiales bacterium]
MTTTRIMRWMAVPIAALLVLVLVSGVAAQLNFGQPVPGQRVYDRTGALSAEQIASLEQRAGGVEAAGSPVFIYLQARDTDYDATVEDARNLMDVWDVQSATDARDGVVIFFNLQPDDLAHGDYAVVAGKALIDGNLPQRELDRITDRMQPLLEDGDIAGAIGLALDTIARDLREGPPPPPPPSSIEQFSDDIAGSAFSILNAVAVAIAAVAAWLIARAFPARRSSNAPVSPATAPPDMLQPGLAGALVTGSVSDVHISATILDLAARGALAIEPDGKKKVQIRVLDGALVRPGFEEAVWNAFASRADADGVVAGKQLDAARKDWGDVRSMIQSELVQRGWFDPIAGKQRTPFYIAAVGLFASGIGAVIVAAIAESPWALVAVGVLATVAVLAFVAAVMIPNTTPDGDAVAAPWRGYQRYLKSAGRNPQVNLDLDTAVPYAVALGASGQLDKRLKSASAEGYLPAWLGGSQAEGVWGAGFYPYWIAFNSSVSPTSTMTASTGASAGSGASGGSF